MSNEGSVPKAHEDGVRFDVDAKGDVVIRSSVLVAHNKREFYYSRVNSMKMAKTNPFFASFFDPEKFSEGREVEMKRNQLISKYGSLEAAMRNARYDELPHVTVEMPYLPFRLVRTTLIAWAWRLMHMEYDGYITLDPSWDDAALGKRFMDWLGGLSILSDRFKCSRNLQWLLNARIDPSVDEEARSASPLSDLRVRIDKSLRPPKVPHGDEGRLRQMIYVSGAVAPHMLYVLTTFLITVGSIEWYNEPDVSVPGLDREIWWHLPDGLEEELRFRHRCISNTISHLQAYFLRAYGAYIPDEENHLEKSSNAPRPLQCRRMYDNSRQCDAFHLGEMVRFTTQRSKTLELHAAAPYIWDEDEDLDEDEDEDEEMLHDELTSSRKNQPKSPSRTIRSLRSMPEYQIDDHHQGCGPRRQLIPALDCIESLAFNGAAGVCGRCIAKYGGSLQPQSWRRKGLINAKVAMSGSTVQSITYPPGQRAALPKCEHIPRAEVAAALFAAKHKVWCHNT